MIVFTLGELGISAGDKDMTPEKMKGIRRSEFIAAGKVSGFETEILEFNDMKLSFGCFEEQVVALLRIIRQRRLSAIFSIHPHEVTPVFDHPDHNRVGEVARYAAAAADVAHFYKEITALNWRPELYLWTTNQNLFGVLDVFKIILDEELLKRRLDFLKKQYPSQFGHVADEEIIEILSEIFPNKSENYVRVR